MDCRLFAFCEPGIVFHADLQAPGEGMAVNQGLHTVSFFNRPGGDYLFGGSGGQDAAAGQQEYVCLLYTSRCV